MKGDTGLKIKMASRNVPSLITQIDSARDSILTFCNRSVMYSNTNNPIGTKKRANVEQV